MSEGDLQALTNALPELGPALRGLVDMAWLLQDPNNLDIFSFFGAYSGVGFSSKHLPEGTALPAGSDDPFYYRRLQIITLSQVAASLGVIPKAFGDDQAEWFVQLLGPLADQEPTENIASILEDGHTRALDQFVDDRKSTLPSLRALILQSTSAQRGMVSGLIEIPHENDLNVASEKLEARLKGEPQTESSREKQLLDLIEAVADRDTKRFAATAPGARWLDKKTVIQHLVRLEPSLYKLAFTFLIRSHGMIIKPELKSKTDGAFLHPLTQMARFENTIKADSVIDQGLTSFFRRLFAEVILGKPTLSGRKLQQSMRTTVESSFRGLRVVWRAMQIEAATPVRLEDRPTREQRMNAYADQLRAKAQSHAPNSARADGVPRSLSPHFEQTFVSSNPELDPWDELLDPSRTTAAARAAAELFLRPDAELTLSLKRSGMKYRVELSPNLIAQLFNPEAGEPHDLRRWLEAMQMGPARSTGQQGWKKLKSPYRGIFNWEIKILGAPYRILGYKRFDGVWRFHRIERMHK